MGPVFLLECLAGVKICHHKLPKFTMLLEIDIIDRREFSHVRGCEERLPMIKFSES